MKGTPNGGGTPDLSTRQLRTVVAVARFESFLAASAEMRTSQSAVSRTVKQVERMLGVALFDRTTRRVSLTAAGREFIPIAERVLDDIDIGAETLRKVAGKPPQRLHIACLTSLTYDIVPAALAAFQAEFPDVEVVLRQRLQNHIMDDVRSGAVDIGIANRVAADDQIAAIPVGADRYHAMIPRRHRLAGRAEISIADLDGERMVSVDPASNVRRMVDRLALDSEVTIRHAVTLDHITLADRFVRRGLGIAIVPAAMRPDSATGDIAVVPLAPHTLRTEIVAYHTRERTLPPATVRFVEILRQAFPGIPANTSSQTIPSARDLL